MDNTFNNIECEKTDNKRWHFDVSNVDLADTSSKSNAENSSDKSDSMLKEDDTEQYRTEKISIGKLLRNRTLIRKILRKYVPWTMMVVGLFFVLIYNRYAIEDLVKEKNATQERIKYLREYKIQMQQKYQESTKISKLAEELDTIHIGLLSGPPYEL